MGESWGERVRVRGRERGRVCERKRVDARVWGDMWREIECGECDLEIECGVREGECGSEREWDREYGSESVGARECEGERRCVLESM